jgi:nucleotide-binding universal stress UspA family protein
MYEQILVALDGSAAAERVLPHVEALAEKFKSRIILLRTRTPVAQLIAALSAPEAVPPVDPTPLIEAEEEDTRTYLSSVAANLKGKGLNVEFEYPEGDAAETIVRRAQELGADLIGMTTHGRGGLLHLIFGSVAEEVLRKAACPILLVRVREKDR